MGGGVGAPPAEGGGKTFRLTGYLDFAGSKRGERYFNILCNEPYQHTAFVTVFGDAGREGDDDLNEDLSSFIDQEVTIECRADELLGLHTRPSCIVPDGHWVPLA